MKVRGLPMFSLWLQHLSHHPLWSLFTTLLPPVRSPLIQQTSWITVSTSQLEFGLSIRLRGVVLFKWLSRFDCLCWFLVTYFRDSFWRYKADAVVLYQSGLFMDVVVSLSPSGFTASPFGCFGSSLEIVVALVLLLVCLAFFLEADTACVRMWFLAVRRCGRCGITRIRGQTMGSSVGSGDFLAGRSGLMAGSGKAFKATNLMTQAAF
nr:hypothetical protein [Tanacetum cinerariifolium]